MSRMYSKSFLVHKIQYMCGDKYPERELWQMTNFALMIILENEEEQFWRDFGEEQHI